MNLSPTDIQAELPPPLIVRYTAIPSVRPTPIASSEISDDELEQHIDDSCWLWRTAYERYQLHGNPLDRDEALVHLQTQNQAILGRSPAAQAARHAAFEQRISEGVDYFQSEHALELGRARDA